MEAAGTWRCQLVRRGPARRRRGRIWAGARRGGQQATAPAHLRLGLVEADAAALGAGGALGLGVEQHSHGAHAALAHHSHLAAGAAERPRRRRVQRASGGRPAGAVGACTARQQTCSKRHGSRRRQQQGVLTCGRHTRALPRGWCPPPPRPAGVLASSRGGHSARVRRGRDGPALQRASGSPAGVRLSGCGPGPLWRAHLHGAVHLRPGGWVGEEGQHFFGRCVHDAGDGEHPACNLGAGAANSVSALAASQGPERQRLAPQGSPGQQGTCHPFCCRQSCAAAAARGGPSCRSVCGGSGAG